jgi:hypothetical protein
MATKHLTIGEVATVLPGYAVKGRVEHDPAGCCQVILGKHLVPGQPYRYSPAHELRITPRRGTERYLVVPGDVLLASRGAANYTVEVKDVPDQTIAPATFYVLRPRVDLLTAIHPGYLAWVLEQAPTQAQIAQIRTGAATPIIQRDELNGVTIPFPPLAEQRRIAALAALVQRERDLLRQLDEATQRKHQAIGSALYQGPLRAAATEADSA